MTTNPHLLALAAAGVSVWLDDLSRARLTTGNLAALIEISGVVGVTTNPSIFQSAISDGESYAAQIATLAASVEFVDVQEHPVDAALTHLSARYPGCMTFLFEPRPQHAFFGATPELLARVQGDRVETMAL